MKTWVEVFSQMYLNRSDIALLLNVSRAVANRTFAIANTIDDEQLPFRTYPNKVRTSTVLKIHGTTRAELWKQMKTTGANGGVEIGEPLEFHQIITRGEKK